MKMANTFGSPPPPPTATTAEKEDHHWIFVKFHNYTTSFIAEGVALPAFGGSVGNINDGQ